jgi:hypothetical protein
MEGTLGWRVLWDGGMEGTSGWRVLQVGGYSRMEGTPGWRVLQDGGYFGMEGTPLAHTGIAVRRALPAVVERLASGQRNGMGLRL